MLDFGRYRELVTTFFVTFGARFLVALFFLFIGLWIIRRLVKLLDRLMRKHQVDPSLRPFLGNILNISLKILLIIAVVAQLGMEMTSVFAVLGSAGLAIGLASQGSLSNFAGGVLILTIKPFRVGDYIEAQGVGGRVCIINILNTVITTADNKTIYIPNGPLANSTITNHDVETNRRTEIKLILQHGNNIDQAKSIIKDIINADNRILPEPAPQIISENSDLGVVLITRAWTARENIGGLSNDLHDRIRIVFDQENIILHGPRKTV